MKTQTILGSILFLASIQFHFAQQAIGATGSNASGTNGSSSYTVGQIDYLAKGSNSEVTEGVQQNYEIYSLASAENSTSNQNIILYPNPTTDVLFVDFQSESFTNSSYRFLDAQGKIIMEGEFTKSKNQLNLQGIPSSLYILQIIQNNKQIKSYKIIKKH